MCFFTCTSTSDNNNNNSDTNIIEEAIATPIATTIAFIEYFLRIPTAFPQSCSDRSININIRSSALDLDLSGTSSKQLSAPPLLQAPFSCPKKTIKINPRIHFPKPSLRLLRRRQMPKQMLRVTAAYFIEKNRTLL